MDGSRAAAALELIGTSSNGFEPNGANPVSQRHS
jgi:hypothetical protein